MYASATAAQHPRLCMHVYEQQPTWTSLIPTHCRHSIKHEQRDHVRTRRWKQSLMGRSSDGTTPVNPHGHMQTGCLMVAAKGLLHTPVAK